jgi:NAD/NADP transhydrogenase beta subunit
LVLLHFWAIFSQAHLVTLLTVCIAGSLIGASGLILSVVAPNVPVLLFTYGIVGGFGMGMVAPHMIAYSVLFSHDELKS